MDFEDKFSPKFNKKIVFSKVLDLLEIPYEVIGPQHENTFTGAKVIVKATKKDIAFIDTGRNDIAETINVVKAGIIFCDEQIMEVIKGKLESYVSVIVVSNPKLVYSNLIFSLTKSMSQPEIHKTAVVGENTSIHASASIGEFCVIGDNVNIGKNSRISSHCFIGKNVYIGNDVNISPGARIGNDGFGYVYDDNNEVTNFPHIGGVIIEDFVDIGANTCIDRGGLGNTHLKEGCKLDNLVHIAHNVIVGRQTFITANTMIAGSTTIGDNAYVAPSASIKDGLSIEADSFVGIGAALTKNVSAGETWAGNPARKLRTT